jgi:hypothetical protein
MHFGPVKWWMAVAVMAATGSVLVLVIDGPEETSHLLNSLSGFAWPAAALGMVYLVRGALRRAIGRTKGIALKLPNGTEVRVELETLRDVTSTAESEASANAGAILQVLGLADDAQSRVALDTIGAALKPVEESPPPDAP